MTDLFAALLIIFVTTCDLDCCLYNQNKKKNRKRLILESQYYFIPYTIIL